MLVQVALIVFALCGLLALVVDVGAVRLTQGQMQNAADTAALEGLRNRDVGLRTPAGQFVNDPFASDCIRRAAANRMVRRTFDDDLDPVNGDPAYQFGAGPIIGLTGGTTTLHAGQTISATEPRVYKPDPQLNQQNQVYGDMVSGRFCYTADPVPSEGGQYEVQDIVCTEEQRGSGTYSRNDFNPSGTVPAPPPALLECPAPDDAVPAPWPIGGSGSISTVNDSAFLVRLRRSNEFADAGLQGEPSVASTGPTLPLTFGAATTISADDPNGGYSVRRDGLTVRATAIASVQPAMRVGLPRINPPQAGVAPFVVVDNCVQSATGAAVTLTVSINPTTGIITRTGAGTPTCPTNAVVGRFVANGAAISTVGQIPPVAPVAVPCLTAASFVDRYGPVYSLMQAAPANRVIGFTRVAFTRAAVCPAPGLLFTGTIVRGVSLVAPSNATAEISGALPVPITAPAALVRELFDKNRVRAGRLNYAPVLVAALAR